jgi:hypothetical protein
MTVLVRHSDRPVEMEFCHPREVSTLSAAARVVGTCLIQRDESRSLSIRLIRACLLWLWLQRPGNATLYEPTDQQSDGGMVLCRSRLYAYHGLLVDSLVAAGLARLFLFLVCMFMVKAHVHPEEHLVFILAWVAVVKVDPVLE